MNSEDEADRCLRDHCGYTDADFEEILRQIDAENQKGKGMSIAESPVWKDQQFLDNLSRDFMARDFEKSRKSTKHYIDNAAQPARTLKMGNPKRGADGRVLRDGRGLAIWDQELPGTEPSTSENQQNQRIANHFRSAQGTGALFPENCASCSSYGSQADPCPIVGGLIDPASGICDLFKPKQHTENASANGKVDVTKSIMGVPLRGSDGRIIRDVRRQVVWGTTAMP